MLQITLGKGLIITGLLLVIVGGLLVFSGPFSFLGRMPGDIYVERPGLKIYFPITTCLFLSIILSAILYLISKLQ